MSMTPSETSIQSSEENVHYPLNSNSALNPPTIINDGSTTQTTAPLHPAIDNAPIEPSAPVPDILLSLAKDERYISHTFNLLAQTIVPLASLLFPPRSRRSHNNSLNDSNRNSREAIGEEILEQDGHAFIERIRPELHLVAAAIVHSATFVFYTRHFGNFETGGGVGGGRARRSIGMESLNLAYSFPKKERRTISSSDDSFFGVRYIKNLIVQTINSAKSLVPDRWQALLVLQTIIPYLIQRAGRGGWSKDLGGLVSSLLECCVGRRLGTTVDGTGIDEANGDSGLRNDDRLRGMERRRLFEAQRRRMLASATSQSDVDPVNDRSDEVREETNETISFGVANNDALVKKLKKAADHAWDFLRRISLASSSLSRGAHTLATQGGTAVDTSNFDRYTNILKWLLRLHLALFYWNGMYPTIYHRLVGARISDNVPPSHPNAVLGPNAGVIVANRPTYKPVAVLILLQALTALVQTAAEASIELVHSVQIAFFRWRRQRTRNPQLINNEQHSAYNSSEREIYLGLVEERVPSVASVKDTPKQARSNKRNKSKEIKSIHSCGICLNERVHPAASSVCGHVFCWNCILHWVSNVRAECPLCRAQTRPQDVLPLYNYP